MTEWECIGDYVERIAERDIKRQRSDHLSDLDDDDIILVAGQ